MKYMGHDSFKGTLLGTSIEYDLWWAMEIWNLEKGAQSNHKHLLQFLYLHIGSDDGGEIKTHEEQLRLLGLFV